MLFDLYIGYLSMLIVSLLVTKEAALSLLLCLLKAEDQGGGNVLICWCQKRARIYFEY